MRSFLLLWALLPLSLEWQFKTFSTQLTSAICFLLVPGRCLTSQKIKIETMKANHFNFLLSYLQIYLKLPLFLFPPLPAQRRKCPFPKLLLWTDSPRPLSFSKNNSQVLPSWPLSWLTVEASSTALHFLLVSLLHPDCSRREHATHNWGHVTVLCKTFFHGLNYV